MFGTSKYTSSFTPSWPKAYFYTQLKGYRFTFNGMEKVDEINGSGNALDFGARIYDARLGRWMSVDPLSIKYPDLSPYIYCANNSILFIDPNGKEIIIGGISYIPPQSRTAEYVKKVAESSSFSQQTFEAMDYIYQQAQNAKVNKIDDLINSSIKVNIEESTDFGYESAKTGVRFSDGTPSSPGAARGEAAKDQSIFIKFNPKAGLVFKNDKKRSSVVGLAHELDHASEANAIILLAQANGNNPAAYMNRAIDYAGDGEEQRAVGEGSLEQIVATPLNQYWRTNYKEDNKNLVKFIATKSVKSTEENQTLSDQEKQNLNNANNSIPR